MGMPWLITGADRAHVGDKQQRASFQSWLIRCSTNVPSLKRQGVGGLASERLKQRLGRYGVVTLHRASNVDERQTLARLVSELRKTSEDLPLVFPAHPRTRNNLRRFGIELGGNLVVTEPLGYVDFLNLWRDAALVLTDSGGLQEETTALGVPCLTLRENTERPITVSEGTNTLVGTDPGRIVAEARSVLSGRAKTGRVPPLWDGKAAIRIVGHLDRLLR